MLTYYCFSLLLCTFQQLALLTQKHHHNKERYWHPLFYVLGLEEALEIYPLWKKSIPYMHVVGPSFIAVLFWGTSMSVNNHLVRLCTCVFNCSASIGWFNCSSLSFDVIKKNLMQRYNNGVEQKTNYEDMGWLVCVYVSLSIVVFLLADQKSWRILFVGASLSSIYS